MVTLELSIMLKLLSLALLFLAAIYTVLKGQVQDVPV